jgi:hypothetical protein
MSIQEAQRLYDMQSDDSSFSDEDQFQEDDYSHHMEMVDIDKIEKLFMQARKLEI